MLCSARLGSVGGLEVALSSATSTAAGTATPTCSRTRSPITAARPRRVPRGGAVIASATAKCGSRCRSEEHLPVAAASIVAKYVREAIAQTLLDEQGRQTLGHLHDGFRVAAAVADTERGGRRGLPWARAGRLDADIMRTHPFDHVLHELGFALRGVEVEFAHDLFEARAAQDLLIERGQTILEPNPYGRLHIALGDLLRHDENERLGAKPIWQAPGRQLLLSPTSTRTAPAQATCGARSRAIALQVCSSCQESCSQSSKGSHMLSPTRTPLRLNVRGNPTGRSAASSKL